MDIASIKVPAHVTDPARYRAAVARTIAQKAANARAKKAAVKMLEWINGKPERVALLERLNTEANKGRSEFYCSLRAAFQQWGCLTERQEVALVNSFAKADAAKAERLEANKDAAARSKHVGMLKQRTEFTLTLVSSFTRDGFDGPYQDMTFEDPAGNRLRYAGNSLDMERGDTRRVRATVIAHTEWDGVAQTKINRPAIVETGISEEDFLSARHSGGSAKPIKL